MVSGARLLSWLLVLGVLLAACGSTPPRVAQRTASSGAPASAAASGPAFGPPSEPEADRAMEHIRVLASDIGVRESGTPEELRAAEYIRDALERAGYRATLEAFTVDVPRDKSVLFDVPPGASELDAIAMPGAPDGEARARLVSAGLGRPEDYTGVDARGAVVLVNRGVTTFRDKAVAAQQAGALALIVANNQPGRFRGSIPAGAPEIAIPVVGASSDAADLLDVAAAEGAAIGVRALRVSAPFESRNVVGHPSEEPCTGYVGSHYDSVPRAPGANDNASGTAGMLELARTQRTRGLCFVAFGAEELGLFGSKALIRQHGVEGVRFMLNLDMLGVLNGPEVVASTDDAGSRSMADRAARAAGAAGVTVPRGAFPAFASSDHASFTEAGVPAVTLYSGDDQQMHTPGDDFAHISASDLGMMLKAAAAILRDQLAGER